MSDISLLDRIREKHHVPYRDEFNVALEELAEATNSQVFENAVSDAVKDTAEPLSSILKRVDINDLEVIHKHYLNLLDAEVESLVSRMRHRSSLLRVKADELDMQADVISNNKKETIADNQSLMQHAEMIEELLRKYAHIEPTRV